MSANSSIFGTFARTFSITFKLHQNRKASFWTKITKKNGNILYSRPGRSLYIAFFKDTLTGYPDKPNEIVIADGRYRWAGCDGGCSYELAIQLIVTMVGKQHYNNCLEIFMPWLIKMYKTWSTLVRSFSYFI